MPESGTSSGTRVMRIGDRVRCRQSRSGRRMPGEVRAARAAPYLRPGPSRAPSDGSEVLEVTSDQWTIRPPWVTLTAVLLRVDG